MGWAACSTKYWSRSSVSSASRLSDRNLSWLHRDPGCLRMSRAACETRGVTSSTWTHVNSPHKSPQHHQLEVFRLTSLEALLSPSMILLLLMPPARNNWWAVFVSFKVCDSNSDNKTSISPPESFWAEIVTFRECDVIRKQWRISTHFSSSLRTRSKLREELIRSRNHRLPKTRRETQQFSNVISWSLNLLPVHVKLSTHVPV